MKVGFCLLILGLLGVSLSLLPWVQQELPSSIPLDFYEWWFSQVRVWAIPLVLIILNFFKGLVVTVLQVGWGLWLGGLSLFALLQASALKPYLGLYGYLYIATVGIFSIALVLFGMAKILQIKKA